MDLSMLSSIMQSTYKDGKGEKDSLSTCTENVNRNNSNSRLSPSAPLSNSYNVFQNSSDPCAHVVHVLLCYHQGGEDPEFIRKAIESLVKKLKDKRSELDALISAVTSGGKQSTGCVTIHRSLDGRLQVAGRKGVPHVVYARIWRWPNVNKNELQKIAVCTTPNDHPDFICINPFHYDRIVSSGISNIELSSIRLDPLRWVGEEANYSGTPSQMISCPDTGADVGRASMEPLTHEFTNDAVPNATVSNEWRPGEINEDKQPFLMFGPNQQPACVVSHLASGGTIHNSQMLNCQTSSSEADSRHTMDSTHTQFHQFNNPRRQETNDTGFVINYSCPEFYRQSDTSASKSDSAPTSNMNIDDNDISQLVSQSSSRLINYQANVIDQRYNHMRNNVSQVAIPATEPPEHWCTVLYYELDTQVGETFKVVRDQHEVSIDGGMNPSGGRSGRFCLGALSNVHRSLMSEKARLHIGKGVQLKTTADGSVYLKCLSRKGIFVRSYFLDFEHGLIYGSTVHKFCSGAERKIFDLQWAFAEMCEQRESAQLAVVAQAYAVAGIVPRVAPSLMERAGIGVDDLRRVCCTIAISFVKGWGSGYNRSSIKETPCWVEVHLHRSLQLLNLLLQKTN